MDEMKKNKKFEKIGEWENDGDDFPEEVKERVKKRKERSGEKRSLVGYDNEDGKSGKKKEYPGGQEESGKKESEDQGKFDKNAGK